MHIKYLIIRILYTGLYAVSLLFCITYCLNAVSVLFRIVYVLLYARADRSRPVCRVRSGGMSDVGDLKDGPFYAARAPHVMHIARPIAPQPGFLLGFRVSMKWII